MNHGWWLKKEKKLIAFDIWLQKDGLERLGTNNRRMNRYCLKRLKKICRLIGHMLRHVRLTKRVIEGKQWRKPVNKTTFEAYDIDIG